MKCAVCGDGELEMVTLDLERSYKGHTVIMKGVKGYRCASCGEEFYQGEDVERVDALLATLEGEKDPEVMTVEEAARFLRVSNTTLYAMLKKHQVPARRVGREWRFSRNALVEYLSTTTQ